MEQLGIIMLTMLISDKSQLKRNTEQTGFQIVLKTSQRCIQFQFSITPCNNFVLFLLRIALPIISVITHVLTYLEIIQMLFITHDILEMLTSALPLSVAWLTTDTPIHCSLLSSSRPGATAAANSSHYHCPDHDQISDQA